MKDKFLKYCTNTNLHTTVILPGGCNASCHFCYDISGFIKNENYVKDLDLKLKTIPNNVKKLAITGMEPTISSYFGELLGLLKGYKDKKYDFIFLNTNGYKLLDYAEDLPLAIDAVNISRHAFDDDENYKIFNTKTVPSLQELKEIVSKINKLLIVNINTVITDSMTYNQKINRIYEMIEGAKYVGADSLTVRFEATDLLRKEPLLSEFRKYETIQFNMNPGCKFWLKNINGLNVVFKYVTKEPTNFSNFNYGYIIQRDLKITRDWAGKLPHKDVIL